MIYKPATSLDANIHLYIQSTDIYWAPIMYQALLGATERVANKRDKKIPTFTLVGDK